jgi:hypothetical protein
MKAVDTECPSKHVIEIMEFAVRHETRWTCVDCSAMAVSVQECRARTGLFIRSKWPHRSRGDGHGKKTARLK